jgi:hypothetical protein
LMLSMLGSKRGFRLPWWVTCYKKWLLAISLSNDNLLVCIRNYCPLCFPQHCGSFLFGHGRSCFLSPHCSTRLYSLMHHLWLDGNSMSCNFWLDRTLWSYKSKWFHNYIHYPLSTLL